MPASGKLIDERYLILKKIGAGGFGAVYLAEDTRFGGDNRVAIKQIQQADERVAQTFRREANLLYNLSHPNLPKVTNCFEQDGSNFIVMNYVSGEDLAQSLARGKRFSIEEVLQIADAVLDALEYLHSRGIFHRDIKPHNIKIDESGRIFLLDFGTAKGHLDAKTLTLAGGGSGGGGGLSITGYTPFYAPLEQVLRVDANSYLLLQSLNSDQVDRFAAKRTDQRSDIYSFGATIYHLLTGFSPEKATATVRAHAFWSGKQDPLPPCESLNPEISPPLAQIIRRALALEPDERFQTARELRNALRNLTNESADFPSVPTATVAAPPPAAAQYADQSMPTFTRAADLSNGVDSPAANFIADLPPSSKSAQTNSLKYAAIAAAVLLIVIVGGLGAAALLFRQNSATGNNSKAEPSRFLTYSLLVQKMRGGKEYQEPFESSGQEIFERGYRFQMRLTPPDDGYLYIFAEGLDERGETAFNLIFPTPDRNNGLAGVSPVQQYETGWNEFDGKTGTENFWVIWDKIQPEIAEQSRAEAFENLGKVKDKDLAAELGDFLNGKQNKNAVVSKDAEKKLTKVGFNDDSIVYLLQLEHR